MRRRSLAQEFLVYGLLALGAVGLLALALWDARYNDRAYQTPLTWGLVVLGGLSIVVVARTWQHRRKDRKPIEAYVASLQAASQVVWQTTPLGPRPVQGAAGMAIMQEPPRAVAAPTPVAVAEPRRVEKVQVPVASPKPNAPLAPEAPLATPHHIPGPTGPHEGKRYGDVEVLSYEIGRASLTALPMAADSVIAAHMSEPVRILCDDCGAYFMLFIEPTRPAGVMCPQCQHRLTVSGKPQKHDHVWTRCKICGQYQPVLTAARVSTFHCPVCGQNSEPPQSVASASQPPRPRPSSIAGASRRK